jgi:multicomponent Na+:H+ antiporter subunit E
MPARESSDYAKICEIAPKGYRGLILQAVLLMAIWLILSGHYDALHIGYGVVCTALVVWFNARMRHIAMPGEEACGASRIRLGALILYVPWLLWQILIAAWHVAKVVLHPKMPIDPSLVRFHSKLPNVIAKVILGNSITLTPGTITVDLMGDEFLVHSLTGFTAEGLVCGDMQRKVAKLYDPKGISEEDACSLVETIQSGRGM